MQFLDPCNLAGVLGQVRLDGQILLCGQLAQELHQLVGAGGSEAGGDDGLDMLEVALLDPLDGLVHGFLSGLLIVLAAVAVHVDLTDIAGDASLLQLFHQDQSGLAVQGGEHDDTGGTVGNQLLSQLLVDGACHLGISEVSLGGEGVGVQPVDQGHIHAHTQHGVLGCVQMHVGEGLQDQVLAAVLDLTAGELLGQGLIDAFDDAVNSDQIAVLNDVQLAQFGSSDDVTLQDGSFHM